MSSVTPSAPAAAPPPSIEVVQISPEQRVDFDAALRHHAAVQTPLPEISEAFMARDTTTGDVIGVAYLQVRHLMGPWVLTEGCPPETFQRLSDAITKYAREVIAVHSQPGHENDPIGLSYDVYMPAGESAPAGFERLPVEVWQRRVL